jgi:hypothetical protein
MDRYVVMTVLSSCTAYSAPWCGVVGVSRFLSLGRWDAMARVVVAGSASFFCRFLSGYDLLVMTRVRI